MGINSRHVGKRTASLTALSGPRRSRRNQRLGVESLEQRLLLTTVNWVTDGDGFWDVAANWRDDVGANRVPTAMDDVRIDVPSEATVTVRSSCCTALAGSLVSLESIVVTGQALQVTGSAQFDRPVNVVSQLTVGGTGQFNSTLTTSGSLSVTGAATVVGALTVTGGTFSQGGGSQWNGGVNWSGGTINAAGSGATSAGMISLSGDTTKTLGGNLVSNGGIVHGGTGNLAIASLAAITATLTIPAGTTYDLQSDASVVQGVGSFRQSIANLGIFRKTGGSSVSTIGVGFDNAGGAIDVQTGTVKLTSSTNVHTGATIAVSPGASLEFAGSHTLTGDYSGAGGGTVVLDSGTLAAGLAGATLNFAPGVFQWTGGFMDGNAAGTGGNQAGITNVGFITLSGSNAKTADDLFINKGAVTHTGAGSLVTAALRGGIFRNDAGAVYDIAGDADFNGGGLFGGAGEFHNFGTLRKSAGMASTLIDMSFTNGVAAGVPGTIDVQTGILKINRGGTFSSGIFTAAADATLDFTSPVTLTGNFTGSGAGAVRLNGGSFTIGAGGATFDFPTGLFQWLTGSISASPGELTNVGSLSLPGVAGKSLGGILNNQGTTTLDGAGGLTLGVATFNNSGQFVHTGAGNLNFDPLFGLARFNNQPGGLYDLQGDMDFVAVTGTTIATNAGTLRKSAGIGASVVGVRLENLPGGVIDVRTGTVSTPRANTISGGEFRVDTGATLDLSGNPSSGTDLTGTLSGSGEGRVVINDGAIRVGAAGATLDFAPGLFEWRGGVIQAFDGGPLKNRGTLTLARSAQKDFSGTLTNEGLIRHRDTGNFGLANNPLTGEGSIITNTPTGVYEFQSDVIVHSTGTQIGKLNNAGTLRKIAGSGVSQVFLGLDNTGTVDVQSGTLRLLGGVVQDQFHTTIGGTRFNKLTGGTWIVGGDTGVATALDMGLFAPDPTGFALNQANVTLGAGSTFTRFNSLRVNAGSFGLTSGRDFSTAGNFTNTGSIALGPASTLTVTGNYTQASDLTIDIGGDPASGLVGQLAATGAANLDGDLNIRLANGFGPTDGQVFTVMTFASTTGAFDAINGLTGPGGETLFTADVTDTAVILNGQGEATADLAVVSVTPPATGSPGQPVTITYTVQNQRDATARGPWIDSLYLSLNSTLDASDKLIGRVTHAADVPGLQPYSESLTALLPGASEGNNRVIVVSDSRGLVPDSERANNVGASAGTIAVTIPTLTLGETVSGTIAAGQELYFRLPLEAGASALVTANLPAGAAELYLRQNELPDTTTFEQFDYQPSETRLTMERTSAQAGNYIVLLRGRGPAGALQPFTLTADVLNFGIRDVVSNRGSNAGSVTPTLRGAGFTPQTTASLIAPDGSARDAVATFFQDASTIGVSFDLTGLAPGDYDVRVDDASQTATATGAFTVTAGNPGRVEAELTGPSVIRVGRVGEMIIDYSNPGETDVAAPLFVIQAQNAVVRFPDQLESEGNGALVLGISGAGPAGVLPPGARGRAVLKFVPESLSNMRFTLAQADSAAIINWDAIKDRLQPAYVPADAWDVIFANFLAEVGSTVGQLHALLQANATYLSQFGIYTGEVTRLIQFELEQADDFGTISQRYRLGAFGRGWDDPTDIRLTTDASGNVTVRAGATLRFFRVQPDLSYRGHAGEFATLTLQAGVFRLLETNGVVTVFNADGTLDFAEDPNGNRITGQYSAGRVTGYVDTVGDSVSFVYDARGRIVQATDHVGRVTSYSYDASGEHLLSITGPEGTTSFTYVTGQGAAREHALASITYPDDTHDFFEYDSRGRLVRESIASGLEPVAFTYGTAGEVTVTDADEAAFSVLRVELGKVAQVRDELGNVTQLTYDDQHNLTQLVVPLGNRDTSQYDALGNLTEFIDPLGNSVGIDYEPGSDRPVSIRDPNGNRVNYAYDARGNLTAITHPDGSAERYSYDARGNPTELTNRREQRIRFTYGAQNLVERKDYPDGSFDEFTYDSRRNLTVVRQVRGTAELLTGFAYDGADRLTRVDYPNGRFIAYTYDTGGRRTKVQTSDGFVLRYRYDGGGRLEAVLDGANNVLVSYFYDNIGRLARKDHASGIQTTYLYYADGRLKQLINRAGGAIISSFGYVYDGPGRITSVDTLQGRILYGYDASGQLTSVELPGGRSIHYVYDPAGNRVTMTDTATGTTDYAANNLNQYTSVRTATFEYDLDGNLISRTDGGGTTSYAYDEENRLTRVQTPTDIIDYEYDVLGHLTGTVRNGERTEYLVDPTGAEVLSEFGDAGNLLANYAHSLGEFGLVGRIGAGESANFYQFDGMGNTVELMSTAGEVLNQYSYLPFGERLSAVEGVPNPFTYEGQAGVRDGGGGRYLMGSDLYDAALGRFAQPHPLGQAGGDANLYRYDFNRPTDIPAQRAGQGVKTAEEEIRKRLERDRNFFEGLRKAREKAELFRKTFEEAKKEAQERAIRDTKVLEETKKAREKAELDRLRTIGEQGLRQRPQPNPTNQTTPTRKDPGSRPTTTIDSSGIPTSRPWPRPQPGPSGNTQSTPPLPEPDWDKSILEFHSFDPVDFIDINLAAARDPNDIVGPAGFGPARFLTHDQTLPYTIHFENLASATAPAQSVTVTEQLDADLDFTTFAFGDFGFGDRVIDLPDGRTFFNARVDARDRLGLFVDVTGDFNATTGQASWTFSSIDPTTLDLPADPFAGFLPPNQTSPEGEGFVSYTVRSKDGLTTGTEIRAVAEIVFDTNAPITTNQIDPQDPGQGTDPNKEALVTIDAGVPTSSVNPLPAVTNSTSFTVTWSGADDADGAPGSGIAFFDVFVSDNGGPYQPFKIATTNTSATFTGEFDHTYSFFAVATDNVGHSEAARFAIAEATTRLVRAQTMSGPQVADLRLPTRGRRVTGLVVAFDRDMNTTEAQRLANYELLSPGKDRRFCTRDDRALALRTAVYKPADRTVTLTPVKKLKINQAFQLTIQDTVTDAAGNRLDGDENAEAGGDHIVRGGAWTRIVYTDDDGDRVALRLDLHGAIATVVDHLLDETVVAHLLDETVAGMMEVVWGPTITGRRLRLIDTVPGESVLRGAVHNGRASDGQTVLESITGLAGVRNWLPASFAVGTIASVVDELLETGLSVLKA